MSKSTKIWVKDCIPAHINNLSLNTVSMEYNKIKVSIVIPVYNTEKYVRQAVESVMSQTLKELEIIIINVKYIFTNIILIYINFK